MCSLCQAILAESTNRGSLCFIIPGCMMAALIFFLFPGKSSRCCGTTGLWDVD